MTIWCVGRNYVAHAQELGNEVPIEPLFFIKSEGCLVTAPSIPYPKSVASLHYELELAVKLDSKLNFSQMALALDLTDRDKQNQLKSKGEPWTLAKSFIDSCPLSPWIPFQSNEKYTFELKANNQLKQFGDTDLMVHKFKTLLEYLKSHFPIRPGDIVLTGTPSGVGPLKKGDILQGVLKSSREQILIEWPFKIE